MWPALAQLLELLPHFTRLIPAVDRFLQSKSAGDEANRRAFEAAAEGLRNDLGQVTAAHVSLYRQLNDHSEKLANLASAVSSVKLSVESVEARLSILEARFQKLFYLLAIMFLMLSSTLLLIAGLFLRSHR